MCGIAGFCKVGVDFLKDENRWKQILNNINAVQKHRGPNEEGIFISKFCGLCHVRLSIIDLKNGQQPMTRKFCGEKSTIVYNGEIYNAKELKVELEKKGVKFKTNSDTEVILMGHMVYGNSFVEKLNGIFAYAIWNEHKKELLLCRDRVGVKPLFYTVYDGNFIFSSEIKGLFEYPGVKRRVDKEGLCEIFGLGPAKTPGKGVFKDVFEILPGHIVKISEKGIRQIEYWRLQSKPHEDSLEKTIEKTSYLVQDAIKRQLVSEIPICTFLSGGVDSSLVTAICALELQKNGQNINTFSFDYVDNKKYFKANSFQPSQDRPWVDLMVENLKTNHQYLECDTKNLIDNLFKAVDARDLPCMADVESSLLYFCSRVSKKNRVVLTGECADEIFGGYPWFHEEVMFKADDFPWSLNFENRTIFLSDFAKSVLRLKEYSHASYQDTISKTPKLYGETKLEERRREISFLNLRWFMVTLLDRMDRTSMHCGLEARVPFADHRIIEYLWNIPWEMKCCGGIVKGLLRKAGEKFLPKEVLYRKKSPYPKTYNPFYEQTLKRIMFEVISNNNSPICEFINKKKILYYLKKPSNYDMPWYGQLMAGPQMIAYMLQINYWFIKYGVEIV